MREPWRAEEEGEVVRSGKERVGGRERRRERSKGAAGEEVEEGKAEKGDGARGSAWKWAWGSVGCSEVRRRLR